MELLSLSFIGWFYTIAAAAALGTGATVLFRRYRAGGLARRYAGESLLNDVTLFAIWTTGLIGATGVLQGATWAPRLLEFFCWALCAMVLLSGAYRLLALKRAGSQTPGTWAAAVAGMVLVAAPILALCGATIVTLRSSAARLALTG